MRAVMSAFVLMGLVPFARLNAQAPSTIPGNTAPRAPAHYTTADTDIGTLLDDSAAKAILDKHIPGFSSGGQIDMARPMTLQAIQPYASDILTDQVLAEIDKDLAQLPGKR